MGSFKDFSVFENKLEVKDGLIIKTAKISDNLAGHIDDIKNSIEKYTKKMIEAEIPLPLIKDVVKKDNDIVFSCEYKGDNLVQIFDSDLRKMMHSPRFSEMISIVKKAQDKGVYLDPHPKNFVVSEENKMFYVDFLPPLVKEHIDLRMKFGDEDEKRMLKNYFEGFDPKVLGYHIAADMLKMDDSFSDDLKTAYDILLKNEIIEEGYDNFLENVEFIKEEELEIHNSGIKPM